MFRVTVHGLGVVKSMNDVCGFCGLYKVWILNWDDSCGWQHGLDMINMRNKPLILHVYMYTWRIKGFVYAQVHIYMSYDLMQLILTSSIDRNKME